nr:MAG TPA: hypothetical protein [Caudoviricetes sp.]
MSRVFRKNLYGSRRDGWLRAIRLSKRLVLNRWVIMPAGRCFPVSGRSTVCCVVLWR